MLQHYLIYLRKSRQDDPNETVEQVLSKHEAILQEFALRELGDQIGDGNIYREVISGESIDERHAIKRLLARIESPDIFGVLVVDPQRLTRGDLSECGRIISDFRYTRTKVITPMMTYDLDNKMDRRFFQDELLRGSDYLEYTKEILRRGREAAVKRGCYLSRVAPYGFDKVKIGKDHTLEPNEDADVVRMIYDWYVNEDMSWYAMQQRLADMGIPGPSGGAWHKEVLSRMVRNPHYAGKVVFNSRPTVFFVENGEKKKRRNKVPFTECIVAEGKHPAIIDMDTWERAQEKAKNAPRLRREDTLVNPLAGLLRCSKCGRVLDRRLFPSGARYFCPTKPQCFKSIKVEKVMEALRVSLESAELPSLRASERDESPTQEKAIERLQKQMEEYRAQEETQYELLETKKYTQALFDRRNSALREKMAECEARLIKAKESVQKPKDIDGAVISLERAIQALQDEKMDAMGVNKALKSIVSRIVFTGSPCVGRNGPRNPDEISLEIFLKL